MSATEQTPTTPALPPPHPTAGDATATGDYAVHPAGIPEETTATLDLDACLVVFTALMDAIASWDHEAEILSNDAAYRRLRRLAEALLIVTDARLTIMAPLVDAVWADDHAAAQWRAARLDARTAARSAL